MKTNPRESLRSSLSLQLSILKLIDPDGVSSNMLYSDLVSPGKLERTLVLLAESRAVCISSDWYVSRGRDYEAVLKNVSIALAELEREASI